MLSSSSCTPSTPRRKSFGPKARFHSSRKQREYARLSKARSAGSTCCSSPRATHHSAHAGRLLRAWKSLRAWSTTRECCSFYISLPLLEEAEAPKVVSVLAGGLERATIELDDLDLKKPGNFGGVKAQGQYAAMNTMTLEKLANENPNVTFIHSWPGWVNTGNVRRSADPNSITAWLFWLILEPVIFLFALSYEESGQRHLFQSTSAAFGGRGVPWKGKPGINSLEKQADGLFLVNYKCDCTPNAKVMPILREKGQAKIWDHTQKVLRPYL